MPLPPQILERLERIDRLIERAERLVQASGDAQIRWELTAAETKAQNAGIRLRGRRDWIDSTDELELADREIRQAEHDIDLLDERAQTPSSDRSDTRE